MGESETVRRKPAPDSVFSVLQALGCASRDAVYVGDSDVDIETAKNACLPCFSVLWGFRDEQFLRARGATVTVRTPDELTERFITGRLSALRS